MAAATGSLQPLAAFVGSHRDFAGATAAAAAPAAAAAAIPMPPTFAQGGVQRQFFAGPLPARQGRWWRLRPGSFAVAAASASDGNGEGKGAEGDERVQSLLEDMVRLQSGKVEVERFTSEKAQQLSAIMEGADDEYRKIAEGAKAGMDSVSARILNEVDSSMEELERQLAAAKEETARRDKEFDEFEKALQEKQNQGLFFKNLYKSTKPEKGGMKPNKEQVLRDNPGLASASKTAAASKSRRTVYGVLALLAALTLAKALQDQSSLTSILACSGVLVALIFQIVYELSLSEE